MVVPWVETDYSAVKLIWSGQSSWMILLEGNIYLGISIKAFSSSTFPVYMKTFL